MYDTHRGIPLAAYDMDQNLIEPQLYRQRLQGALVEVHFCLTHYTIRERDTFTEEIDTIRVLRPPPPSLAPGKRKLPQKFESPTTRPRVA